MSDAGMFVHPLVRAAAKEPRSVDLLDPPAGPRIAVRAFIADVSGRRPVDVVRSWLERVLEFRERALQDRIARLERENDDLRRQLESIQAQKGGA